MPAARGAGAGLARRRSTAAAEDGGGAPGGAARPKQAVRASGLFCGARHARSVGGWQHPTAWRGPRPGASRRSTRNAHGFSCKWLFVTVVLAKLGRKQNAPRERKSMFGTCSEKRAGSRCKKEMIEDGGGGPDGR